MNGEWCYLSDSFTKEECNNIIKIGNSLELEDALVGAVNSVKDNNWRNSKRRFLYPGKNTDWIFTRFWETAAKANSDYFGFDYHSLRFIQFTSYEKDEFYHGHQDLFVYQKPQRKLSVTVQLSDPSDYIGGELYFENLEEYPTTEGYENMKDQGTAIFFPSFVRHGVKEVTEGTRYSLVAWFEGPDWK